MCSLPSPISDDGSCHCTFKSNVSSSPSSFLVRTPDTSCPEAGVSSWSTMIVRHHLGMNRQVAICFQHVEVLLIKSTLNKHQKNKQNVIACQGLFFVKKICAMEHKRCNQGTKRGGNSSSDLRSLRTHLKPFPKKMRPTASNMLLNLWVLVV